MKESVRRSKFVVTNLAARPCLAPKFADLGPAPAFDSCIASQRQLKKTACAVFFRPTAGDEGIEPSLAVLETAVLPLN